MIGIGVAIAFGSAIANALALVLQAVEARQTPPDLAPGFGLLRVLAQRPRWVVGTGLVILSWPLQIVALGFAPITVVQPILASFQLFLLVFTRVGLAQRIGWREYGGALAIAAGVSVLIVAAPSRTVLHPSAGRLAGPLVLLAAVALGCYALERRTRAQRRTGRLAGLYPTLCAGLGYAWADFVDKLISNDLSIHRLGAAALWLITVGIFGFIAFTSEQSALQIRSPTAVGPLIGALQEPLPVLLALWGGLEVWQGHGARAPALIAGILLVLIGATIIARSPVALALWNEPDAARGDPSGKPESDGGA